MTKKLEAVWESDGRGSVRIELSDFEHCSTEKEIEDLLDEMIDDDHRMNASWRSRNHSEVIGAIFEHIKKLQTEEEKATP